MFLRIIHITLALWLFVSSTGAPLFRHFCMNRVKTVSLFAKAESCQPQQTACQMHPSAQKDGIKKKKCCEDRIDYLKFSTDLTSDYSVFNQDIIAILPTLPAFQVSAISTDLAVAMQYRPPPLTRAIHILVQSFRC